MKDLIIIGASGFGREVAWLVERINRKENAWNLLGFVDDDEHIQGENINGVRVLGKLEDVTRFPNAYYVCAIGSSTIRSNVINRVRDILPEVKFGTLVDPSVEMSEFIKIGQGSIICAHTLMTVNISIGNYVIINLDCTIGHDAEIQEYVTIYPSVNISGNVTVLSYSEIGTGTQIIQGKNIGTHSIVGAGSVVIKDIPSKCTAVGIPAKPIKFHK